MSNRVMIETNPLADDVEVSVSDDYDSCSFWVKSIPADPTQLAALCMISNNVALDILEGAIANDSDVDTNIGFTDVSRLEACRQALLCERDAKEIGEHSPSSTHPSPGRRI